MDLISYLQQPHSIDVLLTLQQETKWSRINRSLRSAGITVADGCFRQRAKELEELGFLERRPMDKGRANRTRHTYHLTELGTIIAQAVEEAYHAIAEAYEGQVGVPCRC